MKLESGLKISTLKKYAKSFDLELEEDGKTPLYYHKPSAFHPCDFACNGQHGFDIAEDIKNLKLSVEKGREDGKKAYNGNSTRNSNTGAPGNQESSDYWDGYNDGYAWESNSQRD